MQCRFGEYYAPGRARTDWDTIPGQAFGDGEDPTAGEELGEDPLNDRGRAGVEG